MIRNIRKAVAIAAAVLASFAFAVPTAQADEMGAMHYSCGQPRPPQLDGSPFVALKTTTGAYRGSSFGCGSNGVINEGDKLDYYCFTVGNDGHTWTYASAFVRGIAGWVYDEFLPDGGSLHHCPI